MWTDEIRARYDRRALRYTHDLTDEEWAEIASLIPPSRPGGNKRTVTMREVVNGLMYILGTGCQWRDIPKDLPPRSTIHDYLDRWMHDGTLECVHHTPYVCCRELADCETSPTAAVIDSQSVKSAEKSGACIDPHGYDAGKKIKGKKRHIVVDTTGLLMHAIVHAADIQDRDGGAMLMATLFGLYPFLMKLYADGGYQGAEFRNAMPQIMAPMNVEIVKRSDQAKGFVVLPKRWVVERTFAWLNGCRRLAKDWECLNCKARAFLLLASIRLMFRRLVFRVTHSEGYSLFSLLIRRANR